MAMISMGLPVGRIGESVRDEIAEELAETTLVSDDRARRGRVRM